MLYTNLKIAFRNLAKYRAYAVINILGLALGMAVSVLILIFVMHEFSYDRFHTNHERVFRAISQVKIGENVMQLGAYPLDFAPEVKAENPHVEGYVRMMTAHKAGLMKNPSKPALAFSEPNFTYADPSFLKVFSFKLINGDSNHALDKPTAVVISERTAKKYFGSENPVGKVLEHKGKHLLEVTAVIENPPSNSSFNFDFLVPLDAFPTLNDTDKTKWAAGGNVNTYFLLDKPESAAHLTKMLNEKPKKKEDFGTQVYSLDALATSHLGNNFNGNSNAGLIYIFAGIAALILALALFNYVSLTTARATLRAKEVGVRKVVGSGRGALIQQFYTESVLVCIFAFVASLIFVEVLRQPFYDLLGLTIDASFLFSSKFLTILAGLFCATAVVAGIYPAFVLSGFSPLQTLMGRFSGAQKGISLRKSLIVFQFAVSVALIVGSLVVRQQVRFMRSMKLGFDRDQVLAIPVSEAGMSSLVAFRNDIAGQAGVQQASVASGGLFRGYDMMFIKSPVTKKDIGLVNIVVDKHFVKTLGLEWKTAPAPGTFDNRPHILLNELAVKELGIAANPLGRSVPDLDEVGGVVSNFYFTSPQNGIKPMGLIVRSDTAQVKAMDWNGIVYVRFEAGMNLKDQVKTINGVFAKHYRDKPFDYYFLDDAFNATFESEIRMSAMLSISTALAIFIACMGLFGLITFTAETRTREIGIRKVLGASVSGIVMLLSRDFVKLIVIAILIALPAAWYFMDKWLQDFTYRIEIPVWIYIVSSSAAVVIALVTISFQSIKAALANPVESLRSD